MLPGLTRAAGIHYPASAGWTPAGAGRWMLNRRSRRLASCLALIAALGAPAWPAAYAPRVHAAAQTGPLATAFATAARTFGVPEPLLLALSYVETRWNELPWNRYYPGGIYGPMALNDPPTGPSTLRQAATAL